MEKYLEDTINSPAESSSSEIEALLDRIVAIAKRGRQKKTTIDHRYGDYAELFSMSRSVNDGRTFKANYEIIHSAFPEKDGQETLFVSYTNACNRLFINASRTTAKSHWEYSISH